MEIPKQLKDEIWEYCRVNSITNIDEFTIKLLKQGFTVEKYGAVPNIKPLIKVTGQSPAETTGATETIEIPPEKKKDIYDED